MKHAILLSFLISLLSFGVLAAAPATQPAQTTLTILGCTTATPGAGEDTASFLINDTLLIDCGWNVALRMLERGGSPLKIDTLFFTHCHHDHVLGLPGVLFYRGMNKAKNTLNIVGPPDDMPLIVDLAQKFLQQDRFPNIKTPVELHTLEPGQTYETPAWKIETVKSIHGVTGVCSRFTDKATGAVIAFSGDTAPNAAFARLARGADLLIHEASLPPTFPEDKIGDSHSRSIDAARLAREAGVKRLLLIHLSTKQRQASLAAARAIFPDSEVAADGMTLNIRSGERIEDR